MGRYIEILLNILFWLGTAWVVSTLVGFNLTEVEIIRENDLYREIQTQGPVKVISFAGIPPRAILFYLNTFLLIPLFYKRRSLILYLGFLVVTIAACVGIELLILKFTDQLFDGLYLRMISIIYGFYLAVSVAYGAIRHQVRLEHKQQSLAKEKLSAELQLMRSQINPHFLFNALNNLLAISERHEQPEISEGISRLSHLLRFIIYDTQSEFIPLEQEIEFIRDYIQLNGLRYSENDPIEVRFKVSGNIDEYKIAPALLIPFIENAFKHGIAPDKASFVRITIDVKDDILDFTTANSMHHSDRESMSDQYHGVGLENVRKRLKLIYPHQQSLTIREETDVFKVALKLQLS
ncbi:MAG: GHKL domain-containing protein [Bacteroidetes bacterium]|nr:MAG: GHKL domain-containing protein [Bacteroidota bacterium]